MMERKGIVIIKLGGRFYDKKFLTELRNISSEKWLIIVHGGGELVSQELIRLKITPKFINGLRYTDRKTLRVLKDILKKLNSEIVEVFKSYNIVSKGVTAKKFMICKQLKKYGLVGKPKSLRKEHIERLLKKNIVPIIAPIGRDEYGTELNVNSDDVAGAIAGAMRADKILFLTDKPGVLDDKGVVINELPIKLAKELLKSGVISGGMIPKVKSAIRAVKCGVKEVWITSTRDSLNNLQGTKVVK